MSVLSRRLAASMPRATSSPSTSAQNTHTQHFPRLDMSIYSVNIANAPQARWLHLFGPVARMGDSHDMFMTYVNPWEDRRRRPPWSSTSHLAKNPKSQPPTTQPWTCSRLRQTVKTVMLQSGTCP